MDHHLSAQRRGRTFEKKFAEALGVKPQPGSGNTWMAKMDVADGSILWNLKYSGAGVLRFAGDRIKNLIAEAELAITGPGGIGGSVIPGVATEEDGEVFVTFRASDFRRLASSDEIRYITSSRAENKRSTSKVPALLREIDAEGDA